MMTSLAANPGAARGSVAAGSVSLRVWGAEPCALHDLMWASRCIQVARPGHGADTVCKGPALYMLLDRRQLVMLDIDSVLKRMHWAAPRAVRLRISVHDSSGYTERVKQEDDRIRFVRVYGRAVRRCERAWLTADASIARAWASAPDTRVATRAIRGLLDARAMLSVAMDGISCDAEGPGVQDWMAEAVGQWRRPNAVFPEVFEYQPGVWVHEQTTLDAGVRFVGNAWVGAGVNLSTGTIVAGPVLIGDETGEQSVSAPAISEVDWDLTRSPHWTLPSLTQGSSFRRIIKRVFDLVFSLCVLAGTLPLYIPIMIAIMLEDGRPFFFAHTRQTLGGREFPCLKFRTMRKDAEQIKAQLISSNSADGPQFYMENDPRVTRVGRILRKYQFDELPQFLNVLVGHMSVVGPRPSPEHENQFCPTWREARLSIRPGVTGLWQVSRTREPQTDFQEWIRYDLEYVQHQSFVGDLRIIFETVRGIVS